MKNLGLGLLAGLLLLALAGFLQKQHFESARAAAGARAGEAAPAGARAVSSARAVHFSGPDAYRVVDLYVTRFCGYCAGAKKYLTTHGIAFREHDVEERDGEQAYRDVAGAGGALPLLVVGSRRHRGFSEAAYNQFFGRT